MGKVLIVTGRLSLHTGGPLTSISNVARTLATRFQTHLVALSNEDRPTLDLGEGQLIWVEGWRQLARQVHQRVKDAELVVVVGVWHPAFAITLFRAIFAPSTPVVLVPTNSLSSWDWNKHRLIKRALSPALKAILHRVNTVVVASTGEAEDMRPRMRRTRIIPHAVRTVRSGVAHLADPEPNVLFAARVVEQKNLELLIDAVARTEAQPVLRICGTGDATYISALEARARKAGVRAEWLGWRERGELLTLMSAATIVAVSSYSENFCHSAAEAAAIGTPVLIVDRIISSRDLSDSPAVSTVAADPDSMARGIDRAISSPPSHGDIAAAIAWAEKNWAREVFDQRWLDEVDKLTERPK